MFEGCLPCSNISPFPFYDDSTKKLQATLKAIRAKYSKKKTSIGTNVVDEWDEWEKYL